MELYVHYPFCVKKCRYCDFLSGPAGEETRQAYLSALEREIRGWGNALKEQKNPEDGEPVMVTSVYFGGGTPSLMSAGEADHLMFLLAENFTISPDAEITMECNPGTADAGKLKAFHDMGFNRISLGVQSLDDGELALLGRIHTARQAAEAVSLARDAGFMNVNLDLMSALPGQDLRHWMKNLKTAVSLEPDHLSCYSLILEEGTEFARMQEAGTLPAFPDEELDRRMYHETGAFLSSRGYPRYEISNYAGPVYECRHNTGYWRGEEYLGLGPGASSYLSLPAGEGGGLRRVRFRNPDSIKEYVARDFRNVSESALREGHVQTPDDEMEEFMFLGLRMIRGIDTEEFRRKFGQPIGEIYGDVIRRHVADGLLCREGTRMFLSERGLDLANTVMADFMLT